MELTPLSSAATSRDLDLRTLTFDYLVEPTLLLDPHADEIIDANPAACALLGYDRALLRETQNQRVACRPVAGVDRVHPGRAGQGQLLDQRVDAAPCHQPAAAAGIYRIAGCRMTGAR